LAENCPEKWSEGMGMFVAPMENLIYPGVEMSIGLETPPTKKSGWFSLFAHNVL